MLNLKTLLSYDVRGQLLTLSKCEKPFLSYRKDSNNDQNTAKQLDQFNQSKLQDEEELRGARGLDLSSHLDVFHAVWKQV